MNVRNKKPNIVGAQNSYTWYDERERCLVLPCHSWFSHRLHSSEVETLCLGPSGAWHSHTITQRLNARVSNCSVCEVVQEIHNDHGKGRMNSQFLILIYPRVCLRLWQILTTPHPPSSTSEFVTAGTGRPPGEAVCERERESLRDIIRIYDHI